MPSGGATPVKAERPMEWQLTYGKRRKAGHRIILRDDTRSKAEPLLAIAAMLSDELRFHYLGKLSFNSE